MSEIHLMPTADAQAVAEELSGTMFGSPEQFIAAFNDHIFDRSNPKIQELAERIAGAYRNVNYTKRPAQFTLISETEVQLTELRRALVKYETVARMERALRLADEAGVTPADDNLYIGKSGKYAYAPYVYTGSEWDDDVEAEVPNYARVSDERVTEGGKDGLYATVGKSNVDESLEFVYRIPVSAFSAIDYASTVNDLHDLLPESDRN